MRVRELHGGEHLTNLHNNEVNNAFSQFPKQCSQEVSFLSESRLLHLRNDLLMSNKFSPTSREATYRTRGLISNHSNAS